MGVYDIQGINCVFQIKIGSDYKTVVCAKSFTLDTVTDMKETTTVGSGFWKEFRPRKLSYTITFNGMLQVASLNTQEIAKTLFTYQRQFLPLEYQILYTDNSSNLMVVRGTVYVSSSLFDASPVNLVNATQELQGSGDIVVLDQLPQPVNINITSTGDPAIAALIQFKLMNDNGDIIFDSGMLPGASGGDFSHPVNITGQVQSGTYSFLWQVTSDAVGNQFTLDAPPTKTTNFQNGTINENSFGVQTYDFTADRNVTFDFGVGNPPPTCVAPSIPGSPNLPNGTESVPWAYSFPISGTGPFNVTNVTKPAWMSIAFATISGTEYVQLTGTPSGTGLGQVVEFDINNACGSVTFSDLIGIVSNPFAATINWTFTEPGGGAYGFRIYRNGSLIVTTDTANSGTVNVTNGDTVQAMIVGNVLTLKHLKVDEATAGNLYDSTTGGPTKTFSWTAATGAVYTVLAEGLT